MKKQHLLFTFAIFLKPLQSTKIILIHPKNDSLFLNAKNPEIYNVNRDFFDNFSIEERAKTCDEVLKYPIFSFSKNDDEDDGDFFEFEKKIPVNYQYISLKDRSIPEEKNEVEAVGLKFMNDNVPKPQPSFKRFLCSTIDDQYSVNRGDLFLSSGPTKDTYFLLIRKHNEKYLMVYGVVDPTIVEVFKETGTADLINSLARTSNLEKSMQFEICSKVLNFSISSTMFKGLFEERTNNSTFWDHYTWVEEDEKRFMKRNVIIEDAAMAYGGKLLVSIDTVWCEFDGGLTQTAELYISVKSTHGNIVIANVMMPLDYDDSYLDETDDYVVKENIPPNPLVLIASAKLTISYL